MKKILLFLTLLLIPLNVLAYSSYVIPGGDTLGVNVNSKGVMIIGFYKVGGSFNKGDNALKIGDYILKINDEDATTIDKMTSLVDKYGSNGYVNITFDRDGKIYDTKFNIIKEDYKYKTGLYVKDNIKGIGTLSYIDPDSLLYGALGHEIIESNTNTILKMGDGFTFFNKIIGIDKSFPGYAGSKLASFDETKRYGNILKNTKYGIFGKYDGQIDTNSVLKVDMPKIGEAQIRTVINGSEVEHFPIEITKINETSETKNITFKLTSDDLISKTGGVVQGMSGSPIIQDNKIVGVLTHVIVDNPITGYGTFITKMLEEGEK